MKLTIQNGRKIDVHIDRVLFGVTWLGIGQNFVAFNAKQYRDADLALNRIELFDRD